jgi:hypothetical protein
MSPQSARFSIHKPMIGFRSTHNKFAANTTGTINIGFSIPSPAG